MEPELISAQEIVRKFGIPYHTVNYYTAIGLLPVLRKKGNQRVYDAGQIKKRLDAIVRLSNEGYPLNLIRKKLAGY